MGLRKGFELRSVAAAGPWRAFTRLHQQGNARAPSRCHLRWHACAISYDSESAPCKLLDELGFSLLEAPNLKLRTRANGFFWVRKHLHRLKCNRGRCTRPNSSADAKAASTPMANGTTFNLKLPAHCRLLRLWLPKSNYVREDHGNLDENEDRDQASFDAASSNLATYAVS